MQKEMSSEEGPAQKKQGEASQLFRRAQVQGMPSLRSHSRVGWWWF